MVESGRKLGLLAAAGLLLSAVLLAGCTRTPPTTGPAVTSPAASGRTSSTSPSATQTTASTLPSSIEGSTTIPMPINYGPASDFFWGLSGDGYAAYKMYVVQEGDTMVRVVGIRVAPREEGRTYDDIYNHATTSAKQYGIATDKGERLRVLLVEATSEQKVIESRDFSLAGGGG